MLFLKHHVGTIIRGIKNRYFYINNRKFIKGFFDDHGYKKVKPFNIQKWHHSLFLFTALDKNDVPIFIKLTNLPRILKNENKAYKKLQKNTFLKNHLIEHRGYIKKSGFKALILKRANGKVLDEKWASENISKLITLIKIIDEFANLSLVHRDIKLDNFIYDDGIIKIFDFSFMIDKTKHKEIKEIDLSSGQNMLKLITMGIGYKPSPLKWDDYFALHVIFDSLLKNKSLNIPLEQKDILSEYLEECKTKIDSNSYTILK
jgi:serine/threonine protein kinase